MSRAFVKELDGDQVGDDAPELPQSSHPNYITPAGLDALKTSAERLYAKQRKLGSEPENMRDKLELSQLGRHIRHLEGRIARAIVTDPSSQPRDRVCFGATVDVVDEDDRRQTIMVVGEDEADVEHGKVSWVSPIARALLGAAVGDVVTWDRPAGAVELEVVEIRYGS